MKQRFDQKAIYCQSPPDHKVLVSLPAPGSALRAHVAGPFTVMVKTVKYLRLIMSSTHLTVETFIC